jgi:hypothetical protein
VDLCAGLVTDTAPHPMAAAPKPAPLMPFTDPSFGTTVRRLTAVMTGALVPMYSTVQAWNADETKMILYAVGTGHVLFDGKTYAPIKVIDINPPDLEQVYWDTKNPDYFYYVDGNVLVRYDVTNDSKTNLHTFACAGSVSGNSHGWYSFDGAAFALKCDADMKHFIYRRDTNATTGMVPSAADPFLLAPSGTLAYGEGVVVNTSLAPQLTLDLANPDEHASLGRLSSGRDVYDSVAFDPGPKGSGTGTLVTYDMTDGTSRVIVGQATGYPYPPTTTHVSAVAYRQPGWVFVSVVGDTAGQGVLDQEILVADTNPGGKVCRVAHHHSFGDDGPQAYWAEPHVTPSPSGTRVLFGSDWGGTATADTYVVELPSYAP